MASYSERTRAMHAVLLLLIGQWRKWWRLKECGLTTLETRRLRGDQIEVFKILNGYENIDRNVFFSLKKDSRTRGHEVKLVKD